MMGTYKSLLTHKTIFKWFFLAILSTGALLFREIGDSAIQHTEQLQSQQISFRKKLVTEFSFDTAAKSNVVSYLPSRSQLSKLNSLSLALSSIRCKPQYISSPRALTGIIRHMQLQSGSQQSADAFIFLS